MTRTPKTIAAAEKLGARHALDGRGAPDPQVVEATPTEIGYAYVRGFRERRERRWQALAGQ